MAFFYHEGLALGNECCYTVFMSNTQTFYSVRTIDDKKKPVAEITVDDFRAGREIQFTNSLKMAESCLAGSKKPHAVFELMVTKQGSVEVFLRSNLGSLTVVKAKAVTQITSARPAPRRNRRNYDKAL
jgi:hypothetical protein